MKDEPSPKAEERLIGAVERVAGAVDRYGVPALTFAVGTIALLFPAGEGAAAKILPWLGCVLIVAALLTYVWQTSRSTTRVHTTPPTVPTEFMLFLERILKNLEDRDQWQKDLVDKLIDGRKRETTGSGPVE